jgi:RND family efflux transporter MFP subunit
MDPTESPSPLRRARPYLLAAGVLAIAGYYAYSSTRPQPVAIAEIKTAPAERVLAISGRTRPQVTVTVLPKTAGQLLSLTRREGERVKAGELLGRLDAAASRAGLDEVDASLAAARRTVEERQRNYDRAAQLRTSGLNTARDYDQARFDLDQARQELARFSAIRREAAVRVSDTTLIAPVDGVVLSRPVDPGQVVSTQSVVYEIAPLADVEVEAEVDEQFLGEIRQGMAADVKVTGRAQPLAATLYYVAPKVDPRTGGAKIRLRFDDQVVDLRSGLTADINLIVERRDTAVTVARSAILGRERAARVLVVNAGQVETRPVVFVEWPSERVIVESGLRAGDQLVLQPRNDLVGKHVRGVTNFEDLPQGERPRGSEARRAI